MILLIELMKLKILQKILKKINLNMWFCLGMGGSSLCPEVARETFGSKAGFPQLLMLDNTDPAAVKKVESKIDVTKISVYCCK